MSFELVGQYLNLPLFALVASRLGGLIMFQPVLGAMSIPVRVRAMFVLGLAALMVPLVEFPAAAPDTPLGLLLAMVWELLLGAIIGLVTAVCFLGLQWGGMLLALEAGMAFGRVADPNTHQNETYVSIFYVQLGVVLFLVLGGHRALLTCCLDTFETIPLLGAADFVLPGVDVLLQALALSGHVAFRVAAPALLALFLVNMAMGFIQRTMPQFNIIAIGFSLKSMIAFMIMAVSLPAAAEGFVQSVEHAYLWLNEMIGVTR